MEERRRSSDRELGDLAASVRGLFREIELDRRRRDEQHAENKADGEERARKLDMVLGLKPVVDSHDKWIETEGKPTARIVREGVAEIRGGTKVAKYGAEAVKLVASGGIAAGIIKVMAALGFVH